MATCTLHNFRGSTERECTLVVFYLGHKSWLKGKELHVHECTGHNRVGLYNTVDLPCVYP